MKCRQCGKEINKDSAIQIKPRIYVCSTECAEKYSEKSTQNNIEPFEHYDNMDKAVEMLDKFIGET